MTFLFGDLRARIAKSEHARTAQATVANPAAGPTTPTPSVVGHTTSRASAQCGDREPAGGTAATTAAPAGAPSFVDWISPAICDVLADHQLFAEGDPDIEWRVVCADVAGNEHAAFNFDHEWREHVSPIIAERIEKACLALQSQQHTKK